MLKKSKNTKGITLVALIVTIIILLILAGISIASLTGNGLFEKAKLAKEKQEKSQTRENEILEEYEKLINDYDSNNNLLKTLLAEDICFIPESPNWNVKNVKEALDYLYNN